MPTDWNGEPMPVHFSDEQLEAMAIEERNAILEDTTDLEDRGIREHSIEATELADMFQPTSDLRAFIEGRI